LASKKSPVDDSESQPLVAPEEDNIPDQSASKVGPPRANEKGQLGQKKAAVTVKKMPQQAIRKYLRAHNLTTDRKDASRDKKPAREISKAPKKSVTIRKGQKVATKPGVTKAAKVELAVTGKSKTLKKSTKPKRTQAVAKDKRKNMSASKSDKKNKSSKNSRTIKPKISKAKSTNNKKRIGKREEKFTIEQEIPKSTSEKNIITFLDTVKTDLKSISNEAKDVIALSLQKKEQEHPNMEAPEPLALFAGPENVDIADTAVSVLVAPSEQPAKEFEIQPSNGTSPQASTPEASNEDPEPLALFADPEHVDIADMAVSVLVAPSEQPVKEFEIQPCNGTSPQASTPEASIEAPEPLALVAIHDVDTTTSVVMAPSEVPIKGNDTYTLDHTSSPSSNPEVSIVSGQMIMDLKEQGGQPLCEADSTDME